LWWRNSAVENWVALMGRRDEPTDGVEDYCTFLAQALSARGVELRTARVAWDTDGWLQALRKLRREAKDWYGSCVLVQYTGMAWSRRGFPSGVIAVIRMLRRRGARCVVVFHEYARQCGSQRWIDRVRGTCQDVIIRRAYSNADKVIFTVPLDHVGWLPQEQSKAAFVPIGANVPERGEFHIRADAARPKTVAVFGVTEAPNMAAEVETIAETLRHASESIPHLQLVLFGRGSLEAGRLIGPLVKPSGVNVIARGVLSADDVANELEAADVYLFVRGAITLQRGSALAGIACGVPIVGYRNGLVSEPLNEAGIEWAPLGDYRSLAANLVRILSDGERWSELHARNLRLQRNYFSWNRIADLYLKALSQ
jgi:glycosyltransferase involved in cell wall biosynthesis